MFMHGAVVHDPTRQISYVVMADTSQLCGHNTLDGKALIRSAFCPDTAKALLDVVTDLAKRDRAGK